MKDDDCKGMEEEKIREGIGIGEVGGGVEGMEAKEGGEEAREVAKEKGGEGVGNAGGEALEGVIEGAMGITAWQSISWGWLQRALQRARFAD